MKFTEAKIRLPDQWEVRVAYKLFGSNSESAPVGAVFANGWGCPPETTELPAMILADKGYQVLTYEPDATAKLTTADRVHIMKTLGWSLLGPYVAMGFSLGGDVAARVAHEDYASKTFGVVGLADAAGSHEESDRFLTGKVGLMPEDMFVYGPGRSEFIELLESNERASVQTYAQHVAKMTPPELLAYHYAARSSMLDALNGGSLYNLLEYRGGPSYYIHGDGERADYLPDIHAVGHVRVREIPNSGHFMHADSPAAYIGALQECLVEANANT